MKTRIWIAAWAVWAIGTGAYMCGNIRAEERTAPEIAELQRQVRVGDAAMMDALLMAREVNTNQRDGDGQ